MGDISGGDFSLNNNTLSQLYCGLINGGVCGRYYVLNKHTLSKCEVTISFKKIDNDVKKGENDVSSGYGF